MYIDIDKVNENLDIMYDIIDDTIIDELWLVNIGVELEMYRDVLPKYIKEVEGIVTDELLDKIKQAVNAVNELQTIVKEQLQFIL